MANGRADNAALYGLDVRPVGASPVIDVAPCIVCHGTRASAALEVEHLAAPVVVCEECGLGRFHPMLGREEVGAFYPDEYYGEPGVKFQPLVEHLVRLVGARHIGFLSRGLAAGDRVLDVGCGRGVILGPLADRGLSVHGLELSPAAALGADPRAEIRIAPRLADVGYPDGFFREVVIWHVLEHLAEPRATLEEVHRVLAPDGRLIVAVPNLSSFQARVMGAAWFHLDLPRHLYHFPLAALCRLLDDIGFDVRSEHHFSLRQNPFGWIQSALNAVPGLPRNGLYSLLHRRQRGEAAPYGLGMRLLLYSLLALLTPPALAAAALETLLRSGATVHVVATRGASSRA